MSEEEIKRFLGELCIKGFATIMESQIDDEKNKGVGWDIAKATLKHMQDNPSFYYDLGELLYNSYQKWKDEQNNITTSIEKTS